MKNLEFDAWDGGRVVVNREFADVLQMHGLTTFDALMRFEGGTVAKNLLRERTTMRFTLRDESGRERAFYVKRHTPSPLKEYVKPLLRLRRPLLGARHEWDAILHFHAAGIPTMTPVALGESGRESLIVTQALDGCTKLSLWMQSHHDAAQRGNGAQHGNGHDRPNGDHNGENHNGEIHNGDDRAVRHATRDIIRAIARVARTMHSAGMHHQDFYLTHFLVPETDPAGALFVIDLGRVQRHKRLSSRWIVKDLAQLNYSATLATRSDRARFLREYLGRPLEPADLPLLRRIARKSRLIARHSTRHGL